MKTAHWAKVTKSIGAKFGVPFREAKQIFDKLRTSEKRTPSLRMVFSLPKELPKKYQNAPRKKSPNLGKGVKNPSSKKVQKSPKPGKPVVPEKQTIDNALLPKGVKFAPPPPEKPRPVAIPKTQGARNKFEKILKNLGLPVAAIARGGVGKEVVQQWRNEAGMEKLGKQLKNAYNQVDKFGRMKEQTKNRIEKLLIGLVGEDRSRIVWHGILKAMYGAAK